MMKFEVSFKSLLIIYTNLLNYNIELENDGFIN